MRNNFPGRSQMPKNPSVERTVKSFLDVIVLALLTRGPNHGYAIVQEIFDRTGILIGAGVMYPLLYELEDNSLIDGKWTSPERRTRKVYAVTQKGRTLLSEGLQSIERMLGEFEHSVRALGAK